MRHAGPAALYPRRRAADADTLVRVGRFASSDVKVLVEPRPGDVSPRSTARRASSPLPAAIPSSSSTTRAIPMGSSSIPRRAARADGPPRSPFAIERAGKVAIVDTCPAAVGRARRGSGGSTLDAIDLMNVSQKDRAPSRVGMENAHGRLAEGLVLTHHIAAVCRRGYERDGNVTLQEVFLYAKERTVRDSAQMAGRRSIRASICSSAAERHRPRADIVEPQRAAGHADERARGDPSR